MFCRLRAVKEKKNWRKNFNSVGDQEIFLKKTEARLREIAGIFNVIEDILLRACDCKLN
jgi:hypothetical protein